MNPKFKGQEGEVGRTSFAEGTVSAAAQRPRPLSGVGELWLPVENGAGGGAQGGPGGSSPGCGGQIRARVGLPHPDRVHVHDSYLGEGLRSASIPEEVRERVQPGPGASRAK